MLEMLQTTCFFFKRSQVMFKLVPALLRLCTCLIRVMPAGLVLILLHPVVGVPIVPLIESPPRQARVSLSADAGAIFDPKISPQCFFGAFSVVSGITYLKTIYRNISACKNKQMIICVNISALPVCPTDFFATRMHAPTSTMGVISERCSRDVDSTFSLSCLGTSSVSGTIAQLPILWGAPQCGLQRPPWYGTMAGLSHIGMVLLDMM